MNTKVANHIYIYIKADIGTFFQTQEWKQVL